MIVKIEKRKVHQHIVGKEFIETFNLPQAQKFAEEIVFSIIHDFTDCKEGRLKKWQEKDLADLKQFKPGRYVLDLGDFFYIIDIF